MQLLMTPPTTQIDLQSQRRAENFSGVSDAVGAALDLLETRFPGGAFFVAHRDAVDGVIGVVDARGLKHDVEHVLTAALENLQDDPAGGWSIPPTVAGRGECISISLFLQEGDHVGTLCAVPCEPRQFDAPDAGATFHALARFITSEMAREHNERSLLRREHTLKGVNRELSITAQVDALTSVANRRGFDLALAQQWVRCAQGEEAYLAIFDLDDFKEVNDRLGHMVGDQVLQAAAAALESAGREDDFVGRLGGDEFGVILVGCADDNAALEFSQRAGSIFDTSLRMLDARAGFSVGVCPLHGAASADIVFESADRAMYSVKEQRKSAARSSS